MSVHRGAARRLWLGAFCWLAVSAALAGCDDAASDTVGGGGAPDSGLTVCGDGVCSDGEDSCAADCLQGEPVCGDGICTNEQETCPEDCPDTGCDCDDAEVCDPQTGACVDPCEPGDCADGQTCDPDTSLCVDQAGVGGPGVALDLCSGCTGMASSKYTAIGMLSAMAIEDVTATSDKHTMQSGVLSVMEAAGQ